MAATLVQQSGKQIGSNATAPVTKSFSFSSLPTIGNTIIITAWAIAPAGNDPAIATSDNQGNTYTDQVSQSISASRTQVKIVTTPVVTSSGTFTVSLTCNGVGAATHIIVYNVQEWSGLVSSTADKTQSSTTTSTAPSTGTTATTTTANQLLIGGAVMSVSESSWTANASGSNPSSGWTQEIFETSTSNTWPGAMVDQIVSSTGAYVHIWTVPTSNVWGGVIATFDASSVPPALQIAVNQLSESGGMVGRVFV